MLNQQDREQIVARLNKLSPEASPKWGSMNAGEFLAHIIDAFQVTFKEKDVTVNKGFEPVNKIV